MLTYDAPACLLSKNPVIWIWRVSAAGSRPESVGGHQKLPTGGHQRLPAGGQLVTQSGECRIWDLPGCRL